MPNNELSYILRLKDMFSKTMSGAMKKTETMDSAMSKLKNTIAGSFAIGAVVSFGKAVIESLKNYEYFHASLKTMLQGNTMAANALEGQLVTLAKTTPFELTEVQTATKQLLAYGFKAGDVVQTMRTLGDVSSGIGAPLGDIAYLYGTLKTSGRVTLMDLRQFAGRGIPIYETLAKRLKTTTAGINELVHDGKLGFKDVEGAFKDMTKEGGQFFNLMADQSKTVGGKLSNLGDVWEQLKVNIGKSQKGIIASSIDFFSDMLNGLNDYMVKSNKMEEAFRMYGGKGDSFLDKFSATIGAGSGMAGRMTALQSYQYQLEKLNDSDYSAKVKIYQLQKEQIRLMKEVGSRKISKEMFLSKEALLSATLSSINGNYNLSKMKENPTLTKTGEGNEAGFSGSTSLGSGSEVTGQRPQSLTINITKLVEALNVNTTNLMESMPKIKEMVSKALLETVNDVNILATQ